VSSEYWKDRTAFIVCVLSFITLLRVNGFKQLTINHFRQLFIVVNIVFTLLTSAVLTRAKIQTLSFENN